MPKCRLPGSSAGLRTQRRICLLSRLKPELLEAFGKDRFRRRAPTSQASKFNPAQRQHAVRTNNFEEHSVRRLRWSSAFPPPAPLISKELNLLRASPRIRRVSSPQFFAPKPHRKLLEICLQFPSPLSSATCCFPKKSGACPSAWKVVLSDWKSFQLSSFAWEMAVPPNPRPRATKKGTGTEPVP